uniref:Uncharacterized protein n=1 Tax=Micrurus corallinus TaxID=54390 RepID=A0A2D4GFT1_MICCO
MYIPCCCSFKCLEIKEKKEFCRELFVFIVEFLKKKTIKINWYDKKEIVCTWCFLSKRYWANLFYLNIPLVDILTFPRKIGHKERYLPNISNPLNQNNIKKSFGEIVLCKYYGLYREQPFKSPT